MPDDVLVAPSARDITRRYMLAQLSARGDTAPWSSAIPAQRPARFFTIEELNSASEYGAAAESQLLQIRGYDNNREQLGKKMRLIKALWAAMPVELEVQSVEHAGGPLYDEDPDIDGLYYGQLIAWVTVMNEPEIRITHHI